jgi:hypothetical protein
LLPRLIQSLLLRSIIPVGHGDSQCSLD